MRKPSLALSSIMAVSIVIALMLGYQMGIQAQPSNLSLGSSGSVTGHIYVTIRKADGTIIKYDTHNIVVTIGKTRIRDFLKDGTSGATNATKYIALSNDASPDASWTKLPNEITGSGLARAEGTVQTINSTAYNVTHTFTASASVTVQCAGLHWSPDSNSDNNLFACATFTQTTLSSGDTITITWVVNHS